MKSYPRHCVNFIIESKEIHISVKKLNKTINYFIVWVAITNTFKSEEILLILIKFSTLKC